MFSTISWQIKAIVLGATLVVASCAIAYHMYAVSKLDSEIAHQKSIVSERESRISTLETSNYNMSIDIKSQNESINKLVQSNSEASKLAQAALDRYAKDSINLKSKISDLLNQKSTGDLLTDCTNLNNNLNTELSRRLK